MDRWKLSRTLGEDGAVAFLHRCVLAGGQRLVVAFADLVAGAEEQALHAPRPGIVMGVDDEGEFAQQMRAAQGMAAVVVAQIRGPAVVDRDAPVSGNDADRLDGLAAALGVEAFERDVAPGVDVDPVVLSLDAQRGLVDMHGGHGEETFDGAALHWARA